MTDPIFGHVQQQQQFCSELDTQLRILMSNCHQKIHSSMIAQFHPLTFSCPWSLYGGLKQKHNGAFTVDGMGLQISMANWKDDLCDFLELPSQHKFTGVTHVPTIQQGLYRQLDACVKLKILMELVGCCISSSAIRTQIDNNIEEHQLAMANKREAEVEELKRKNEERENLK
jgi:hypothetical protein